MDITILEPEERKMYDKCKYRVKLWEHQFKKEHGRIPSKLDIREADDEVKFAYRTYFNLKSNALEQSFKDIDGFQSDEEKETVNSAEPTTEEVLNVEELQYVKLNEKAWGEDLTYKKILVEKEHENETKVNSSFSKKLFDGSKFSKRNPRKSLSFHSRKSDANFNNPKSLSQPAISNTKRIDVNQTKDLSQDFTDSFITSFTSDVKIASVQSSINSTSLDIIQSVLSNDYKPRRTLDSGWLQRVTDKAGAEVINANSEDFAVSQQFVKLNQLKNNQGYDSDELIENSDDEASQSLLQPSKKIKIDNCSSSQPFTIVSHQNKILIENSDSCVSNVIIENTHKDNTVNDNLEIKTNTETSKNDMQTKTKAITSDKQKLKTTKHKQTKSNLKKSNLLTKDNISVTRKSTRQKRYNFKEDESDNENDPFANDSDKDPEYSPSKNNKNDDVYNFQDVLQPEKRKSRKSKNDQVSDISEPQVEAYELEYSVKSRILSTPRISNVKETIKKTKKKLEKKPKSQQTRKEKLEEKVASGTLNENFVRIDLKKKIYARGKKKFTFTKFKKNMWKKKKQGALAGPDMDMSGCDGGVLKCFICGDVGHFARHCLKKKGDTLLPLNAVEDEEPPSVPTLEEAEKMAQESVLAIRKSNKNNPEDTGESCLEDDNDECESSNESLDSDDELLLRETIKLEQYVEKLDMQEYLDSTSLVKPYYTLKEDGTVVDTPQEVFDTLAMFGHCTFRAGQERAIMRILSGRSTLVTLSTGSGKSLCYQLPAYLYSKREPCISLIISPLVSLMEDQVLGLPGFLRGACLHTNQTKTQREKVKELINSGSLNILLVSPEAIVSGEKSSGFGSFLRKLPPIAFACIDEAHCVSQWSHNFRPSYLMICRILRERLGVNIILGLTATATQSTCDNIVDHLQILDGQNGIVSDVPLPNNLRLTVSKDSNRDYALLGLLLSESFSAYKSIIVYCTRREVCERVATFLRTSLKEEQPPSHGTKKRKRMSCQAEPYHAGLPASRRKSIQKSFMSGELRIVVATVAFGMGINKSDLRAVIHYNMPSSFEGYVQEVGRAGRDGLPAHCHLFLDTQGNDENELRRHIYANSMDRHVIRKLLQKIFIPCSCKTKCSKHEVAFSIQDTVIALDVPEENIATLLCYLELHDNRYIEVLSSAYITCKIISYDGPNKIKKAAKDCPPLAMALALHGNTQSEETVFEFPVVDVAAAMGWDSGICKHKLKNLEWTTVDNQPKRSSLSVQFTNLGFRLLAPGNLSDDQLDEALDSLYTRVKHQERQGLLQLHAIHSALSDVCENSYKLCINNISDKEIILKRRIRQYFESSEPLKNIEIKSKPVHEDQVLSDTRQMIAMYKDNNFTGRAIARIFYGIQSPNYPAFIWGRCKLWRSHLKEDFDEVCKLATREIIKMRT